jgi:hypothetical protein
VIKAKILQRGLGVIVPEDARDLLDRQTSVEDPFSAYTPQIMVAEHHPALNLVDQGKFVINHFLWDMKFDMN